jgi:phosphocarrier protein HPr
LHRAEISIQHPVGLHARPAAIFVRLASSFPANITISKAGGEAHPVNAKSILGVLSLGVNKGDQIVINSDGEREEEALNALLELVRSNFGENQ